MRLADRGRLTLAVLGIGCLTACGLPVDSEAEAGGTFTCLPAPDSAGAVVVDPLRSPSPELPVTVTSSDGAEVTVTDVSRIVAVNLNGSLAEIVFSLGLGDNVVGRDVSTTFAQAEQLPVVTQAHDLSAEGVLDLDPSLVLIDTSIGPPEVITQLRESGVPVVSFEESWSIEEIAPRIEAVAGALGVAEAGDRLVERTEAELTEALDRVRSDGPSPRIAFLYMRGTAGVYLMAGEGSGADSMIEAIGGVDAGSDIGIERFRPITSEALINAAPDVILMMSGGLESVGGIDGLVDVPGVAQTPAGRDRCVVDVEDGTLLSFGPRTGQIVLDLAARIERAE
ncbi:MULTISPECIES: heme/hemin ABC transporter substrate-binding protein [Actinoalloteichus]|uniref:ABC-type hemin transport system, periplasmic component n=1 Tax=Actinoalloteichus fjordicus TaxID=1612552 RepID=A0AAC9LKU0_9PSEU|nr:MULTISPECIES: ABC transporter substrate-binding protein [Actinoalloteichus]APU17939.1 ABC-type hemin transport system, periplasmic component [Actinoalloteichus fjordicus]APU24018.1 ABC-type hemin transport system, periplasmic component [Actinoalloteichus sp. GBA129-24]